jgi:hypothetical protein
MPDIGVDAEGGRDDVRHAAVSVAQAVAELSTAVELVLNVYDPLFVASARSWRENAIDPLGRRRSG